MKPYRQPLVIALGCQLAAGGVVFAGGEALAWAGDFRPPLAAWLVLHGAGAALLGWRFGLAWWWAPIQLLAPAAMALAFMARLPAWIFLAAFVVLLAVFWNSAGDRVPLYLTNRKTRAALAGLLPDRPALTVADLGSGLGGVGAELARRRPAGSFVAIESAPLPFAIGWLRGWLGRRLGGPANLTAKYGDLWSADLGAYDVVYCFLSPAPMPALYAKARAEMRPGSLLVSNSFAVPGQPADRVVEVGDRRGTRLHVWEM